MKINELKITNFRGIENLEIRNFDEHCNVIDGINGAGKTTVLDAIAYLFSWQIARIKNSNGRGTVLQDCDVNLKAKQGAIEIKVCEAYRWSLSKLRAYQKKNEQSGCQTDLTELMTFVDSIQANGNNGESIPVLMYYPVERAIASAPVNLHKGTEPVVWDAYKDMMKWLASVYVNALNIIHYMHDKYCYEKLEMALHDKKVTRWFATGIAGFSVVADSLSAIKYAKVKPIRDENGVAIDFEIEGDFPKYGNDDDRVDEIAQEIVHKFMTMIRRHHTYRDSFPTMSVLTITSNVTYGKATGNTPDGRKKGQPFAPGANPMHGRDSHGAVSSLASVSKLPFQYAQDGISNTFSIIPGALGKEDTVFAGDINVDLNN